MGQIFKVKHINQATFIDKLRNENIDTLDNYYASNTFHFDYYQYSLYLSFGLFVLIMLFRKKTLRELYINLNQ